MRGHRKSRLFLIVLLAITLIAPAIPRGLTDGYGEDSPSLGQFVDDYENDDNVSVAVNVINNQTLDCMELYYEESSIQTVVFAPIQLREHDDSVGTPTISWTKYATLLVTLASPKESRGSGYIFIVVNRGWINGKYFRFKWGHSGGGTARTRAFLYDGEYVRSSMVDFPDNAPMITKGNGLLQGLGVRGSVITSDILIDSSGGSEAYATIMIKLDDYDYYYVASTYLYWLEINGGAGGADNLLRWDMATAGTVRTMEGGSSRNQYGRVDGGDIEDYDIELGGFRESGWFSTTELLSGINGSSLILMTNSTLNSSDLKVAFSADNSTWVDHNNQTGYETLSGGFESWDLRDINSETLYLRYNFTRGGLELTPRLFQTRLISTEGDVPENGVTINYPSIDEIEFNTTVVEQVCGVSGEFSDVEGLSGYIFWENATSPPGGVNSSWTSLTGTSDSALENVTLPSDGTKLGVKYYVNDTDGNWGVDTLVIFPLAAETGDTYVTGSVGIFLMAFIVLLPVIFYAVKKK